MEMISVQAWTQQAIVLRCTFQEANIHNPKRTFNATRIFGNALVRMSSLRDLGVLRGSAVNLTPKLLTAESPSTPRLRRIEVRTLPDFPMA